MARARHTEEGSGEEDSKVDEAEDEVEDGEEVDGEFPEDEAAYPGILACQGREGGLYPGVGGSHL